MQRCVKKWLLINLIKTTRVFLHLSGPDRRSPTYDLYFWPIRTLGSKLELIKRRQTNSFMPISYVTSRLNCHELHFSWNIKCISVISWGIVKLYVNVEVRWGWPLIDSDHTLTSVWRRRMILIGLYYQYNNIIIYKIIM